VNPDPLVTNDIVELKDSTSFRWLGRIDNVINSGGVKILPETVETKLSAAITNRRFFIAGLPDESLGEKVALVVEGEKTNIDFSELEKVERPKETIFLPEFLETDSGKIRRKDTIRVLLSGFS